MLQRQVVSLRSKSALVRRERDALQAEHVRLRSNRDRLVAVAEKVKSRKFNLRAAEAIYVRKWHKLEGISRGLVGLEGALSVCSSDMHAMAELLVERASALGMEMSPVVLPPPKAVRMHIGVEALAIGKQGRPSASRRPASASPLCGAGSSPTSRTAPSRPGSAKHQHKRPGSAVGCSGSVTRHPYQTIASTAGPHSSCTASFSSGPYSPGPGPVCVSGPISEDSATPPGTLSGGIGDGVVGRPLSATNNLPQQRQNSNAAGLPPPPSVAAFSASSPGWLREGGEVRDAPLELHAPLRQLYALSARLEQVAASLAVYTDDVLGGSRVSLESYEEASPRDFLEAIAHPGATAEDPTIMAALVADVIQSRINRASAQTYKGQRQTASLPSYRSAAHRIHAGGSSTSGANFEHDYSGFGDVEYPAAPGPTHGGPFAAAKPRPPMGMIPTSAVQRGQDLESLCRTLAERHAEQLRRERRRQEPQPAHRRRPSRPLPPSYLPGTDIQMPAGPVLGGRAVPRELLPKSADVGAGVNRRSTDMLTAVARGVERQAASASVGNRDALNRRHGNALNIKSGSARSVGSRLNRSAANMSPPKERENTSPPPMQVSKMIPSQSPPRQKR